MSPANTNDPRPQNSDSDYLDEAVGQSDIREQLRVTTGPRAATTIEGYGYASPLR